MPPLARTLLVVLGLPLTVAAILPFALSGEATASAGILRTLAQLLFLAGAGLFGWALLSFAMGGQGEPSPLDPPRQLVTGGPYRWSRNPMFVGLLAVILGWAVLYASLTVLGYGVLAAVAFHLFVVMREEPVLFRKFGAPYEAFRARVPRWLPWRRS